MAAPIPIPIPTDWAAIVEKYRAALAGVVATLFTMAWLYEDGVPFVGDDVRKVTLPRRIHRIVLAHLRAAEAALRRIIAIAACGITVMVKPPRSQSPSPLWGGVRGGGQDKDSSTPTPNLRSAAARPSPQGGGLEPPVPAFALFDPRKSFAWWWRGDWYQRACGEDIPGPPWPAIAFAPPADPDAYIASGYLALRLLALKKALEDIPGQAKRLARIQARARLCPERKHPLLYSVWRPGVPARFGIKPEQEVDGTMQEIGDILSDVDFFSRCAVEEHHDTS
jgi:hypothetical protein